MVKKTYPRKTILSLLLVSLLIGGVIVPSVLAETSRLYTDGFDKGVSWKPYTPLKRATFVAHDTQGILDDYAYLAAIPSTVFYDQEVDRIFTNPLLFFEDEYDVDELKDRSMNARQGIDYFMEDWISYAHGYLDKMT